MLSETTMHDSATDARPRSSLAGARVLICEDEAIIQVQLGKILSSVGVEVVGTAINGKIGVETATEKKPDIVLMDLNIPIIDGMEASRRIIVNTGACVVIISAYGDADFRKRAKEIGVCGYLTKPITSDTLLPELERIYGEYRAKCNA